MPVASSLVAFDKRPQFGRAVGITLDTVLLDRPAWIASHDGGKMKGGLYVEATNAPTIGGRLSYLFDRTSYGNYPDIQALWKQYEKEVSLSLRKNLIVRIQNLISERTMVIPIRSGCLNAAFGPKVKGDPHKIQPLIYFSAPFEDVELIEQ